MFKIPDNNWGFIDKKRIKELEGIYAEASKSRKGFFPTEDNVLRFLNADFSNIKYIVLGMEPYPTDYECNGEKVCEATGRSFEVSSVNDWQQKFRQSSLRNILKTVYYNKTGEKKSIETVRDKIANGEFIIPQPHEWFENLEKQGIVWLNASLTVEPYNVNSHRRLWDGFMTDLILHINRNSSAEWLLWGKDALSRYSDTTGGTELERTILVWHPRLASFVLSNCFAQTKGIDWTGNA